MIGFFGGVFSTIVFFAFLIICIMAFLLWLAISTPKKTSSEYYSQKPITEKPKTPSYTQYSVPIESVNYGNETDFKVRSSTQYHYSFPIIPEDAEARRLKLREYMIKHNLLIKNMDYYDVPNSMNYFRDVYQYHRTYIQGKLVAEDDSYFADDKEETLIHRNRYKVYASLDGKNWIHIGYAPQGKMWDSDFYNGMKCDVQLSGGNYKHMVNDSAVTDRKPYYFYGYIN